MYCFRGVYWFTSWHLMDITWSVYICNRIYDYLIWHAAVVGKSVLCFTKTLINGFVKGFPKVFIEIWTLSNVFVKDVCAVLLMTVAVLATFTKGDGFCIFSLIFWTWSKVPSYEGSFECMKLKRKKFVLDTVGSLLWRWSP